MKSLYVAAPFFLMAFLLVTCSPSEEPLLESAYSSFADSLFTASIDSGYIAGASVVVILEGETVLDKAYGYASLELSAEMPRSAVFEIGSVTKQFTSAAILKLVEEGRISLDDDFTRYLDFDTGGRQITIEDLLDHRSGIASYTEIPSFWDLSIQSLPRDSLVRLIEKTGFIFEPGEAMIYNNSAYFMLGLIIEAVSDTSYEAFLEDRFFKPLGMASTYYCSNSEVRKNKAYGYSYRPDGLVQKGYLDHTWPYAGGSLCSTTEDLITWMQALHGGEVLSGSLYQSMITPGSLNDGTPIRYAKGLANFSDHGHRSISHGGGINGFLSEVRYFPEDGMYLVCLLNTTGPHGARYFADALTWRMHDKEWQRMRPLEGGFADVSGTYSGQARGRTLNLDVWLADDYLVLQSQQDEDPDTIRTYVGNQTWLDNNDSYRIDGDRMLIDLVSSLYVLKKE